jgi:hypothetical protein
MPRARRHAGPMSRHDGTRSRPHIIYIGCVAGSAAWDLEPGSSRIRDE